MNGVAILRRLGGVYAIAIALLLLCAAFATAGNAPEYAEGYLLSAGFLGPVSLVFLFAPMRRKSGTGLRDALILILLIWVTLPLALIPAALASNEGGRISSAYFEIISCLTTTGAVFRPDADGWPDAHILFRSGLHVLGAVIVLTSAILVFAQMNSTGPGVYRTRFFRVSANRSFSQINRIAMVLTLVLCGAMLLIFSVLIITREEALGAMALSVSALTTGMVIPGLALDGLSVSSKLALTLGMILGALNITLLIGVATLTVQRRIDLESIGFGLLVAVCAAIILFLPGTSWTLSDALFLGASLASTSGLGLSSTLLASSFLPIAIFFAFVGGSPLSASGGVKTSRLLVLGARTGLEFAKLGHPKSVDQFTFRGRPQAQSVVLAVWVYLIAFGAVVMLVTNLLSFAGETSVSAMSLSVGAMTNSGGLLLADRQEPPSTAAEIILALAMIAGRLEVLVLLSIARIDYWRR